jgi:1,2-diacylglycerol 3-alpha-glucosyltransferase
MKIALYSDTFVPQVNGVAHSVEQLACALAERGHTVRVYAVSTSASELTERAAGRYTVRTIPSLPAFVYAGLRFTLPLGFSLRDVRAFKPDVIHSHTPFAAGWEAVRAARELEVPLVGTHHTFFDFYLKHVGLDYPWVRRASWRFAVAYNARCTAVVSPTQALAIELMRHGLGVSPIRIPNIIDTKRFRPPTDLERERAKRSYGFSGPVITYVGRLSYEKSVEQVLEAFSRLSPDVHLLIVGDGPERARLEAQAIKLPNGEKVVFTGFLDGLELVEAFHAADICMSASKSENMPLAILEALATGLPVVAVDSLGMREILEDNGDAFLLPPDRPDLLAEKARMLLRDGELRTRFALRAREAALQYSAASVTERFVALYQDLIQTKE